MRTSWERWGAASGLAAAVVGAVAVIFERGPVSPDDAKATVIDHYTENHDALLTQSMLFLAAAALDLWFLAALHAYQAEAEGDAGHMANVAFGAGITWVAINMIAQAFQVGLAQADRYGAEPALIATMNAVFTIAALPLAVMLAAVAVVTLRHRAFPVWLGWIAIVAAAAQLLLWWGTIAMRRSARTGRVAELRAVPDLRDLARSGLHRDDQAGRRSRDQPPPAVTVTAGTSDVPTVATVRSAIRIRVAGRESIGCRRLPKDSGAGWCATRIM